MTDDVVFKGSADADARRCVTVEGAGQARKLLPLRLDLANHSPTGFGWGYLGSGPAQLALAILAEATGDGAFAREHHQEFKSEIVAGLAMDQDWAIPRARVLAWADQQQARRDAATAAPGGARRRLGGLMALGLALGALTLGAAPGAAQTTPSADDVRDLRVKFGEAARVECRAKADRHARDLGTARFGSGAAGQLWWGIYGDCVSGNESVGGVLLDQFETGKLDLAKFSWCLQPAHAPKASDDWRKAGAIVEMYQCAHGSR